MKSAAAMLSNFMLQAPPVSLMATELAKETFASMESNG
jgi:hypothetical protein